MKIYFWFVVGMLSFLFLFILLRLILKAAKMSIVWKILSLVFMAVIMVLVYYILTRVLGVFSFYASEWDLGLAFPIVDSDAGGVLKTFMP